MHRIPYSLWLSWSDQERADVLTRLEGKKWFLDLEQSRPPKNSRISDFESFTGEADSMGLDHRGFLDKRR